MFAPAPPSPQLLQHFNEYLADRPMIRISSSDHALDISPRNLAQNEIDAVFDTFARPDVHAFIGARHGQPMWYHAAIEDRGDGEFVLIEALLDAQEDVPRMMEMIFEIAPFLWKVTIERLVVPDGMAVDARGLRAEICGGETVFRREPESSTGV